MLRKIVLILCVAFVVVCYGYPCFILPFGEYVRTTEIGNITTESTYNFDWDGTVTKEDEFGITTKYYYKLKGNEVLEKPKNKEDAIRMLNLLKNTDHRVITSLTILIQDGDKYTEYVDYDIAKVYFKDMSEKEILKWIEEGNPYDKAGGYAIQSKFGVFVDKVEGNYFTVVGLPIHKLYDVIKNYI